MNLADELKQFEKTHGHYGLRRDLEDRTFLMSANVMRKIDLPPVDLKYLPETMGVSKWMQIENQGSVGSCQGHARTSAEELAIYYETGEVIQLCRMFAYLTSQKIDNITGDNGSTISGGARASQRYGSCLESMFPYRGIYDRNIPAGCWDNALTRRTRTFTRLESYDEVLRWLVNGIGGVVIGIGWNGSCEPDANGCINSYRSGGGGHALALLDWNKRFSDPSGKPYICKANSWGQSWGVDGWAFIAPKVIDYWCQNEDVYAYSDMDGDNIKARPFLPKDMGL